MADGFEIEMNGGKNDNNSNKNEIYQNFQKSNQNDSESDANELWCTVLSCALIYYCEQCNARMQSKSFFETKFRTSFRI